MYLNTTELHRGREHPQTKNVDRVEDRGTPQESGYRKSWAFDPSKKVVSTRGTKRDLYQSAQLHWNYWNFRAAKDGRVKIRGSVDY